MQRFFILFLVFTICYGIDRIEAAWSSDPAENLVLADGAGAQTVPHIVSATDGGCYVSWYDAGAGYDVRVQRLDFEGNEVWIHNGVLVGELNYSSVMDYAMARNEDNQILLAYLSDATGSDQIVANLVLPDGSLPWGSGIQLTSGTNFVAKPEAASLPDGSFIIGWIDEDTSVFQRLDINGSPLWTTPLVITDPNSGTLMVSDMAESEDGSVIASFVQYIMFSGSKHLYVQKIDATGGVLWGVDPVAVFDSGSLQYGNFPDFTTDGAGGAVLSWYDTSQSLLQCYVQHVTSAGSEAFPHNGVAVSTNDPMQRVNPSAIYQPATQDVFVFWIEENFNQSAWGIYGQKISSTGQRMWTDAGMIVTPVNAQNEQQLTVFPMEGDVFVSYMSETSAAVFHLFVTRIDGNGDFVWTPEIIAASTAQSDKSFHESVVSNAGPALLIWDDQRSDDGNVYGQNINPDGSLGNVMSTPTPPVTQTATPTIEPTATTPPHPTFTPSMTPTQAPTATPSEIPTPTETPLALGVRLDLPEMIHPGEEFHVTAYLDNPGAPLVNVPTFVFLEIEGIYWFWPSWDWELFDFLYESVPTGSTELTILDRFDWPDTGNDAVTGLRFWGAMLDDTFAAILGEFAMVEWGYGP